MKNVLIWSNEHTAWWKANSWGYTRTLSEAGLYTLEEAKQIVEGANAFNWSKKSYIPNELIVRYEDLPEEAKMLITL